MLSEIQAGSWLFEMMGPFFCGLMAGGVLGFLLGIILGGFTILGAWATISKRMKK